MAAEPWADLVSDFCKPLGDPVRPVSSNVTTYRRLQRRYSDLEHGALPGDTLDAAP